jgi:2-dehydro-3-deoxyphosphogluconate aldolase/(4S)-4-hydroxy-2-oxoglutarate aldolase
MADALQAVMIHPLVVRLRQARVVPVIRTQTTVQAARVVQWLRDAGLSIFEITLTVPDATGLIRELAGDTSLIIGAGTVPDASRAIDCLAAGAAFLVAPWTDPSLADPCRAANALLMLGGVTPTEVRGALSAGAAVVKVFPASSSGGPAHIRALRSVLPEVDLCPTGGVEPVDVPKYLSAGAAFVGMGGALVGTDRSKVQDAAWQVLEQIL